jgi:hypothetical protein
MRYGQFECLTKFMGNHYLTYKFAKGEGLMAIFIVNFCKKFSVFWLRIFNRWYPAVRAAGGMPMRPLQVGVFIRNLFQIGKSQKLLKIRVFKMEKLPP